MYLSAVLIYPPPLSEPIGANEKCVSECEFCVVVQMCAIFVKAGALVCWKYGVLVRCMGGTYV